MKPYFQPYLKRHICVYRRTNCSATSVFESLLKVNKRMRGCNAQITVICIYSVWRPSCNSKGIEKTTILSKT